MTRLVNARNGLLTRKSPGDQAGVTIIELLVAIVVFAVIASGVGIAMGSSLNLTRNNRNRSIAANLAAARLDEVRSIAKDGFKDSQDVDGDLDTDEYHPDLTPGSMVVTRPVDGIDYTLTQEMEWVSQTASTTACDTPDGDKPAYMRATIKVTWPNMTGAKAVQSQTILTPPVGAYDAATGHIAVKVLDAAALPATVGHAVRIDGPGGVQTQTTADGCAFFAYLQPGVYSVGLVGSTGYVDRQGNNTPEDPDVGVNIGETASVQFDYDEAATLELTVGDNNYPVPENSIPLTIANVGLATPGTKVIPRSGSDTASLRTVTNLFPFQDGYQVWLGDCSDNDPEAHGASRQVFSTSPGQTTTGTITVEQVDVQVVDTVGLSIGDAPVTATGVCGGAYANLDLGRTPPPPDFLKAGLPYGQWLFQSGAGSTNQVLDPTVPDPSLVVIVQ